MKNNDDVEKAFLPNEKLGDHAKFLVNSFTIGYKDLAQEIVQNIPDNEYRSSVLRMLLSAKHMTIQAITHGVHGVPETEKPKGSKK